MATQRAHALGDSHGTGDRHGGHATLGSVAALSASGAGRFAILVVAPPGDDREAVLARLSGQQAIVREVGRHGRPDALTDEDIANADLAVIDVDAGDGAYDLVLQLNEASRPCRSILVGSSIDRASVREAFLVGVVACLRKPVEAPALMSAVRRAAEATALMRRCIEAVEHETGVGWLAGPAVRLGGLTPREREILALLMEGGSTRKMSERLGVSERTIKFHVSNLLRKFDAGSRISLLAKVRQAVW